MPSQPPPLDVVGVFVAPGFWGLQYWEMLGDSFLHHNVWHAVGGVLMKGPFVLLPKALRRKDEISQKRHAGAAWAGVAGDGGGEGAWDLVLTWSPV